MICHEDGSTCAFITNVKLTSFLCLQTRFYTQPARLSRVHNILSPLRDDRKPLIFQWAFTLRNAGIGSVSNPAFYTLKNEWLPVVTKRRRYIMNPPLYSYWSDLSLQFSRFAVEPNQPHPHVSCEHDPLQIFSSEKKIQ